MDYKYQYLTPGYLGEKVIDATINSKFFSLLFSNDSYLNKHLIFPQKVPKTGFFKEIYTLEIAPVKIKFQQLIKSINEQVDKIFSECPIDEKVLSGGFNLLRILMRYGCFQEVISLEKEYYVTGQMPIELQYLIECAKIDFSLSNDKAINLDGLLSLTSKIALDNKVEPWLACLILNRFVVCAYRHQQDDQYKKHAQKFADILLNRVKTMDNRSTLSCLVSSLVYRGIAMVEEWGNFFQEQLINQAMDFAYNVPAKTELECLVVKDNLFPCLQSMAKWHMLNSRPELAEKNLSELLKLDPYDSTGFSEMGIFMLKRDRFEEAVVQLKQAIQLGPPGVGMNTYFYAKALQASGKQSDAITALYTVTEMDQEAISPWLDLFDYHLHIQSIEEARHIVKHIFSTPALYDQLEENELVKLQTVFS